MVLTDWTITNTNATSQIDTAKKHDGDSSLRVLSTASAAPNAELVRDGFLATQFRFLGWLNWSLAQGSFAFVGAVQFMSFTHSDYGTLQVDADDIQADWDEWWRLRVTFWYDAPNDTKWARAEKSSDGSTWSQIGTDTNLGSGAPTNQNVTYVLRVAATNASRSQVHADTWIVQR